MNVNKVSMSLRKLITLLMVSAMCLSDVWAQLENGKVWLSRFLVGIAI